ncbi:hypothetical protein A2999_01510 [Candidatus Wolfebacteria bacterium RIFCSPLOWO2_01_FULL_38_11]|uniref:Inorganic polyphosphate/ATP-NAD kinase n=2 Tax=Candidatus Wolfeibacteriota TaxID=1752735 RepID=A0A0G0G6B9_9BACT|nr:MAG: Inorganic polyphosphate/ATP-NAD kinase [Candidatus Wolfebacteria bacterium GW2011_GWC1_37_10]OGM92138.1 MAG: hypothetical protein A2999_01510 [Candidatus Wolfebacteria bacterium RIFCSPLOWO2_01_FULL_38_11]
MIPKVPKNYEEFDRLLEAVGKNIAVVEELNRELDRIGLGIRKRIKNLKEKIISEAENVLVFSEIYRQELTEKGKHKTSKRPSSELGWRKTPPAVQIKNLNYVVEQLKKIGLSDFIITKEQPDKRMILKNPEVIEKLKGVKISKGAEMFFVRPRGASTEIIIVKGTTKFQAIRKK